MRDALAEHDEILRRDTTSHGGVVFKTIGDAFCCAFVRAEDAADAAIDAQRTLGEHTWPRDVGNLRVRMGIHTGSAVERDGDYFGPTVNRVARLMSIGYGGQILVSAATAALLEGVLPRGERYVISGSHRLRDLSHAETTFQLEAEGLRIEFPALASLDARPNNLPSQISSFVGRERELDDFAIAADRESSRHGNRSLVESAKRACRCNWLPASSIAIGMEHGSSISASSLTPNSSGRPLQHRWGLRSRAPNRCSKP